MIIEQVEKTTVYTDYKWSIMKSNIASVYDDIQISREMVEMFMFFHERVGREMEEYKFTHLRDIPPKIYHKDIKFNHESIAMLLRTAIESKELINHRVVLPPLQTREDNYSLVVDFEPGMYEGAVDMLFKVIRPHFMREGIFAVKDKFNRTLTEHLLPEEMIFWTNRVTPDSDWQSILNQFILKSSGKSDRKILLGAIQRTVTETGEVPIRKFQRKKEFPREHDLEKVSNLEGNARIAKLFENYGKYLQYLYDNDLVWPAMDHLSITHLFRVIPTNFFVYQIEKALKMPIAELTTLLGIQILQALGYNSIEAVSKVSNPYLKTHIGNDFDELLDYDSVFGKYFDYLPENFNDPHPFKLHHIGRTLGLPDHAIQHISPEMMAYLIQNEKKF